MSLRSTRRSRWLSLACVALLVTSACGPRQRFPHGIRYINDGLEMDLSALMPNCGCLKIEPQTVEADRRDPRKPYDRFRVKSSYGNVEIGRTEIAADDDLVERFDWASVDEDERYTLTLWGIGKNEKGQPTEERLRFWDYTTAEASEGPCGDTLCSFGELGLNRVSNRPVGQNQVDTRQPGARFTSDGRLLEAVATAHPNGNVCGCMILLNKDPDQRAVRIQATLDGERTGTAELAFADPKPGQHRTLVVGFDRAGMNPDDRYVLSVAEVIGAQPASTSTTGQVSGVSMPRNAPRTPAIRDLVTVVGQFDLLQCTDQGAALTLPVSLMSVEGPDQLPKQDPRIVCPFEPLRMNRHLVRVAQDPAPTQGAAAGAGTSAPQAERPNR